MYLEIDDFLIPHDNIGIVAHENGSTKVALRYAADFGEGVKTAIDISDPDKSSYQQIKKCLIGEE